MADDDVKEARARANALRDSLPQSVDAAALGVRGRKPLPQLLCTREALIWRTEELARTACDALERDDFAAAALLARATVESAALAWKLMEVLDERRKLSPQELNDTLIPHVGRFPAVAGCAPSPANPELHRPNGQKGAGCPHELRHSERDCASQLARRVRHVCSKPMSRNSRRTLAVAYVRLGRREGSIVNALLGALGLFEFAYNQISGAMPEFFCRVAKHLARSGQRPINPIELNRFRGSKKAINICHRLDEFIDARGHNYSGRAAGR